MFSDHTAETTATPITGTDKILGKIISINAQNFNSQTFFEIEANGERYGYLTSLPQMIYNAREQDVFFCFSVSFECKMLICKTPPLIRPDENIPLYYLRKGGLSAEKIQSLEEKIQSGEITDLFSSLVFLSSMSKEASVSLNPVLTFLFDLVGEKILKWWRKEIVLRRLKLLGLNLNDARKVSELINEETSLYGVYESVLQNPLPFLFLDLEVCDSIYQMSGNKIRPELLRPLKIARQIYARLVGSGWVTTPTWWMDKNFPYYESEIQNLRLLSIVKSEGMYYSRAYEIEKEVCFKIAKLHMSNPKLSEIEPAWDESPQNFESDVTLTEQQQQALSLAVKSPFSLILGSAGTGKTTIIRKLSQLLPNAYLVSFTGKAVSRLSMVTGKKAYTIHKLYYSKQGATSTVTEVIVDEASMVSLPLFRKLLEFPLVKLVMVGDPFQLPPIEWGRPFEKIINSKFFPTSQLTQVFRTEDNFILENASRIRLNEGFFSFAQGANFRIFEGGKEVVFDLIRRLIATGRKQNDITVISPYNSMVAELNRGCQEIFHPDQPFVKDRFHRSFYEGDRIICTENDYLNNVFNGEEGNVTEICDEMIKVTFPSTTVIFKLQDEEDMSKIAHSYVMTVHKAQGSEWPVVIFFLEARPHNTFLNQRLFYTGITRAKEALFCVGSEVDLASSCQKEAPKVFDNMFLRLRQGIASAVEGETEN